MKTNLNKIKKVLYLIEASVDTEAIDETQVEVLAKKHLLNEKKINELQEQIDALINKQSNYEHENEIIKDDILEVIGNVKSQVFRFGKILVDFKVSRETGVSKSAPRWKDITKELQKTYNIEQITIDKLAEKFNNGNKTFTSVNKNLSITKESKQVLKENILNSLRTIWVGFKQIFKTLGSSFKSQNDYLENLLNSL